MSTGIDFVCGVVVVAIHANHNCVVRRRYATVLYSTYVVNSTRIGLGPPASLEGVVQILEVRWCIGLCITKL